MTAKKNGGLSTVAKSHCTLLPKEVTLDLNVEKLTGAREPQGSEGGCAKGESCGSSGYP